MELMVEAVWAVVAMRQLRAMTKAGNQAIAAAVPSVTIRHRGTWVGFDFRELWAHRELLYFLIWRDLKVRYRQTFFGAAWAVLQPVLLMIVFTLLLGRVVGIAPAGVSYPVFVLAALVPWTFFASSVTGASSSLVNAANLVQKVYFPRLLLPLGAIGAYLLDLTIAMVVLLLTTFLVGMPLTITILWLVPLAVVASIGALALGVWLAAIDVRYRDVGHAVPFLIQLLLFATPVFYSPDLVPSSIRGLYDLNPMVGVIDGFRWAVLGFGEAPVASLLTSVAVSSIVLLGGLAYFRRVELTFADVI
jgi:lipopolysaccharide transport system permease protein